MSDSDDKTKIGDWSPTMTRMRFEIVSIAFVIFFLSVIGGKLKGLPFVTVDFNGIAVDQIVLGLFVVYFYLVVHFVTRAFDEIGNVTNHLDRLSTFETRASRLFEGANSQSMDAHTVEMSRISSSLEEILQKASDKTVDYYVASFRPMNGQIEAIDNAMAEHTRVLEQMQASGTQLPSPFHEILYTLPRPGMFSAGYDSWKENWRQTEMLARAIPDAKKLVSEAKQRFDAKAQVFDEVLQEATVMRTDYAKWAREVRKQRKAAMFDRFFLAAVVPVVFSVALVALSWPSIYSGAAFALQHLTSLPYLLSAWWIALGVIFLGLTVLTIAGLIKGFGPHPVALFAAVTSFFLFFGFWTGNQAARRMGFEGVREEREAARYCVTDAKSWIGERDALRSGAPSHCKLPDIETSK